MAWIPPELREDRGELEVAANGGFPRLTTVELLEVTRARRATPSSGGISGSVSTDRDVGSRVMIRNMTVESGVAAESST
jgi:hypothetical protein